VRKISKKDCKEYAAGIKDGERDNNSAHEAPIAFLVGGGSNEGKSGDRSSKSYQSGYHAGLKD
jgi:hypothetical protein